MHHKASRTIEERSRSMRKVSAANQVRIPWRLPHAWGLRLHHNMEIMTLHNNDFTALKILLLYCPSSLSVHPTNDSLWFLPELFKGCFLPQNSKNPEFTGKQGKHGRQTGWINQNCSALPVLKHRAGFPRKPRRDNLTPDSRERGWCKWLGQH